MTSLVWSSEPGLARGRVGTVTVGELKKRRRSMFYEVGRVVRMCSHLRRQCATNSKPGEEACDLQSSLLKGSHHFEEISRVLLSWCTLQRH